MNSIELAHKEVLEGLLAVIPANDLEREDEASFKHLRWMAEHALAHLDSWPIDKTGRWVGFIQGVLHTRGIWSSRQERDRTRPIFHAAYASAGHTIPITVERP